jgi:hypothetical protein
MFVKADVRRFSAATAAKAVSFFQIEEDLLCSR